MNTHNMFISMNAILADMAIAQASSKQPNHIIISGYLATGSMPAAER